MAQLQQISQMLRNNPEQLQLIKQSLETTHPEIAQVDKTTKKKQSKISLHSLDD